MWPAVASLKRSEAHGRCLDGTIVDALRQQPVFVEGWYAHLPHLGSVSSGDLLSYRLLCYRIRRLDLLRRFGLRLPLPCPSRPDVESAEAVVPDFPGPPDALALTEAAVEDIVRRNVTFRPIALEVGRIVTALDEEYPDVIGPVAAH